MEFEIKNLDRLINLLEYNSGFEDFIKLFDNAVYELGRIAKALETIAQEMVVENETL